MQSPHLMYGTAWKKDRTAAVVEQALLAGFRNVDTAGQPKHYNERLVGDGITSYLRKAEGKVTRKDLFIQTKFTYFGGQDPNDMPYNPESDYRTQVLTSFDQSLKNLNTNYIDSYVLHGPHSRRGVSEVDWEVWRTFEELQRAGKIRLLGVSNIDFPQLKSLYEGSTIKPSFVQNRCYATTSWDNEIRHYCSNNGITYQGFSLLTANSFALRHPAVTSIAKRLHCDPTQVIFSFAKQVGMLPLTGTCDINHMTLDLAAVSDARLQLTTQEVADVENCAMR